MTVKKLRRGGLAVIIAAAVSMSACGGAAGNASTTESTQSAGTDVSVSETAQKETAVESGTTSESTTETTQSSDATSGIVYSAVSSSMINFKADDSYKKWARGLVMTIEADGDTVNISGKGGDVTCDGTQITINSAGTYVFEGTLDDGCVTVDADKAEKVRIILNGFSVTSSDGPAFNIIESDKVSISLEDGTENTVTDSETYTDETLSAAISSKADLVFNGTGTLVVNANCNDAIQSKDDLRIINGTYIINSADDGLVGRDRLEIKDGTFEITCGGDAFKSTNTEKADRGFVYIADGTYTINSGDEAVDAATSILIEDGDFTITTAGGSVNAADTRGSWEGFGNQGRSGGTEFGGFGHGMGPAGQEEMPEDFSGEMPEDFSGEMPEDFSGEMPDTDEENFSGETSGGTFMMTAAGSETDESLSGEAAGSEPSEENDDTDTADSTASGKGIKCEGVLEIRGGTFVIDAQDDAINSNYRVSISGGTFSIKAGDDGIHADDTLDISGGKVTVEDSYEGLEAVYINISDGDISVTASDDGMNAAGGELLSQNTTGTDSTEMPAGGGPTDMEPGSGDDLSDSTASDEDSAERGGRGRGDMAGMQQNGMGGMGGMFEESSGYLTISGGTLYVNAGGDGLDANTDIVQTGGDVIVEGPTDSGNGSLDYGNSYLMSGGTLTAIGSAGMLQNISENSESCGLAVLFSDNVPAGTVLSIKDSSGKVLTSVTTTKVAEVLQFAGDGLKEGGTYTLYSDDEELCEITLTGTVTTVNDAGEETTVSGMQMTGGHARA